jgi:hypothetical protein
VSASASLGYMNTGHATARLRLLQPRQTTSAATSTGSDFSRQHTGLQSRIFVFSMASERIRLGLL